jgi:hypothetical protein
VRIRGLSYCGSAAREHRSLPLAPGYFNLGDYTGLVGRNDSGKSSLLGVIHESLRTSDRTPSTSLVFAECSAKEFREITNHALRDLAPTAGAQASQDPAKQRSPWWVGIGYDFSHLHGLSVPDLDSAADAYAGYLTDHWEHGDSRPCLALLLQTARNPHPLPEDEGDAASHLLAFEPATHAGQPILNVSWCLPDYRSLRPDVRDCLDKVRSDGPGNFEGPHPLLGELAGRSRAHWRMADAPIPIAPIGRVELPLLPEPLMLPLSDLDAETRISEAITSCLRVLNHADEILAEGMAFDPIWSEDQADEDPWILDEDPAWRLNPHVADACALVEATAQTLLPPPIAERYQVFVWPRRPFDTSSSRVEVRMTEHRRDDEASTGVSRWNSFTPGRLAAGYQVWLQLALLQASSEVERASVLMQDRIDALESTIEDIEAEHDDELTRENELERSPLWREVEELRGVLTSRSRLSSVSEPSRGPIELKLHPGAKDWLQRIRGTLLLLDEPERHLHPALQRDFSSWLAEVLQRRSTQLITCTHSIPFMTVKGGYPARYSYLARTGEADAKSILTEFQPDQLAATDLIAQEIGLNRGELLTMTRLLLWVEGPMDEAVLDGYFGSQGLRERGISVLLLHGARHTARILEASLLRFTDAEVAVWLDKISPNFAKRLRQDSTWAKEQTQAAETDEERNLAKLACEAERLGRTVHPISAHPPAGDVFDLLDEDVVREEWPKFPGHAAALEAFKDSPAPKGGRKGFYGTAFGVPVTPDSCRRIAQKMRINGIHDERLDGILAQCEELIG